MLVRNSSFLKIKHKIDFTKKLFNYENTGKKKEAGKNIRKSETAVSLPSRTCSKALTAVRQAVAVLTVDF